VGGSRSRAAFTLIEVLIALGIFFAAMFTILELTSRNLRAARAIQQYNLDVSSLAAELTLTNALEEGSVRGDFGDLYPGYTWRRDVMLYGTNGLFEVHFTVYGAVDGRTVESTLRTLMYRPGGTIRGAAGLPRR
jgi:Tfp pilus assembly protein PilV